MYHLYYNSPLTNFKHMVGKSVNYPTILHVAAETCFRKGGDSSHSGFLSPMPGKSEERLPWHLNAMHND